jgi:hypothetical protein
MFTALPMEAEFKSFANPVLANARAAALNQDHRYDDSENGGNNPNSGGGFHSFSPFLQNASSAPLHDQNPIDIFRPSGESRGPQCTGAGLRSPSSSTAPPEKVCAARPTGFLSAAAEAECRTLQSKALLRRYEQWLRGPQQFPFSQKNASSDVSSLQDSNSRSRTSSTSAEPEDPNDCDYLVLVRRR